MIKQHYFQLGGLYHLTIGDLYQAECLKDIKEQLQAIHGVKLQRACTQNQLIFICKNRVIGSNKNNNLSHQIQKPIKSLTNQSQNGKQYTQNIINQTTHAIKLQIKSNNNGCQCGYYVRFIIQFRIKRQLYKLQSFHLHHSQDCFDRHQAIFLRNRRQLTLQSGAITKIVIQKLSNKQQCSNPTSILDILYKQTGVQMDFLYKGVEDHVYKRKLKKKLDNLIAQAKKIQYNDIYHNKKQLSQTSIQPLQHTQNSLFFSLKNHVNHHSKNKLKKSIVNSIHTDLNQIKQEDNMKVVPQPQSKNKVNQYSEQFSANYSEKNQEKLKPHSLSSTASLFQSSEVDPCAIDPSLFLFSEQEESAKIFKYPFEDDQINYDFSIKFDMIDSENVGKSTQIQVKPIPTNNKQLQENTKHKEKKKKPLRKQLAIL